MVCISQKQLLHTIIILIAGAVFTILGAINKIYLRDILRIYTKKLIKLSPTMKFYKEWEDTPNPILNKIYMFNWTNPDDFEKNGAKPAFTELGPYVFREYQKKVNVTWNDNGTVSYMVHRVWYFDPELSNGTLNDNVTTLSIIPLMTAFVFKDLGYFLQKGASIALAAKGYKIYDKRTVGELTFEGHDYSFSFIGGYLYPHFTKFGYLRSYNDTTVRDGVLNVDTGATDTRQVAQVKSWDYSPNLFDGRPIDGTTGELFSSELKKEEISLFTPWLCRNLYFDYKEEESGKAMEAYKFVLSKRNFDNGSLFPENLREWPGKSYPSGIMNLSSCYYKGIVVGSLPHFSGADPYYANQVEGLYPDTEKYDSYILVEPMSGVPLKGSVHAQINAFVTHYDTFRMYQKVPDMIFPIFWIEKSFEMPQTILEFLGKYIFYFNLLEFMALPTLVAGLLILFSIVIWKVNQHRYLLYPHRHAFRKSSIKSTSENIARKNYAFSVLSQNSSEKKLSEIYTF